VAVQECVNFAERSTGDNATSLESIDFVLFSKDIYKEWVEAAEELIPGPEAATAPAAAAAAQGAVSVCVCVCVVYVT
jgi:hypothetical protein